MVKAKEKLIDASPVKSFFVTMLTRDITLEEAILDLLDNCVDGILRSSRRDGVRPYEGFKAEIKFDKDSFTISENCGGIPWNLRDYAFRMGRPSNRPPDPPGTIGVYGIGMKRAIFKIGKKCKISTRNGTDNYEIEITPEWISDEKHWEIPIKKPASKPMKEEGTVIRIEDLNPGMKERFHEDAQSFKSSLESKISSHYGFIIDKGLEVKINGGKVGPQHTNLIFNPRGKKAIQPYIFRTKDQGVEVFLAVGFYRRIPSQNEVDDEQIEKKYSSQMAGWTVVCNDRAVLCNDRTEMTGWGEANVPRYHTQFIAISGIVEFKSDDASKLPTTTTKRSIDASSLLYLQTKNRMREGMRLFTDFTNKWKGREDEIRELFKVGDLLSPAEIKTKAKKLPLSSTRGYPEGEQYKPELPFPEKLEPTKRRISFVKGLTEIKKVGEYLLNDADADASEIGEKCFDVILEEAKEK